MSNDTQSRKHLLTFNDPIAKGLTHEEIRRRIAALSNVVYFCLSDERGLETGTYHTHVYICQKNPVKFSRFKKLFPEAHIDEARGSSAENRAYVQKSGKWAESEKSDTSVEGTFEEEGELPDEPGQGYRSDIAAVYSMIASGMSNAEIMEENPEYAGKIQYMDKIRQEILEQKYKSMFRQLDVTYIWGPTGTGKTRGVLEKHGYVNVYRVSDYGHCFDRYASEPVLCFDEFRSSLKIGDMLQYLDGYPISLPARYANRVACYETVYLISNIDLTDQYTVVANEEPATWEAFLRRIHHVLEYKKDGSVIDHGSGLSYVFPNRFPVTQPDWVEEAENAPELDDDLPI
jgi:hypothetical protein